MAVLYNPSPLSLFLNQLLQYIFAKVGASEDATGCPIETWVPDTETPVPAVRVVIFALPLKLTPLIVLAVVKVAAEPVVFWLRVGTLAAFIVPDEIFDAFKLDKPEPLPEKLVADKVLVAKLKVNVESVPDEVIVPLVKLVVTNLWVPEEGSLNAEPVFDRPAPFPEKLVADKVLVAKLYVNSASVLAETIVPLVKFVSTTLSLPDEALPNDAPVFVRFDPSPVNDVAVTIPWNSAPDLLTISPVLKTVAPNPIGVSAPRTLIPASSIPTLWRLLVPVLKLVAVATPIDWKPPSA